jgi:L-ascorbate metabolism protein UlaG (beta-lactamase superfamily)
LYRTCGEKKRGFIETAARSAALAESRSRVYTLLEMQFQNMPVSRRSGSEKEGIMQAQDMVKNISWLGHDGFRISGSKTVYIDPFQIEGGPAADLVLISHEHYDHCSPEDVDRIAKGGTVIVTEANSAGKLSGDVRTLAPGESIEVDGVRIEAVPSYNIGKQFHPKDNGWLGFVVEMDGVRIYHAGDTDFIPEMKEIRTDIALLPVSGTYVMTAGEAVEAALAIGPKIAIPMHYGAIVGGAGDAEKFAAALKGKVEVVVLEKTG